MPFDVPAGTRRISIVFSRTAGEERTVIDLGLFDPQGFRGWSGSDKTAFTVSDLDSTQSYLPGHLPAGTWKLLLGVPNIRPNVKSEYTANIYLSATLALPNIPEFAAPVLRAGPAWYQGDLHDHTGHSDGNCASMAGKKVPCPQFKVLERAADLKLDFLAVTDHNTVSHYHALQQWQPYFDQLLLLQGREITTFFGHANLYGASEFVDFRLGPQLSIAQIAKAAHDQGALLSINHPARPSGESCMGCGWTAPNTDFAQLDAVEAVNGNDADTLLSGIPFWQARLNEGHRMTAIGGSDDHNLTAQTGQSGALGTPTTVVYARELSERAILDGIKAGHVFLKLKGPAGPSVYVTAGNAMVGDAIKTRAGEAISFAVQVVGAAGAKVEVISDGKEVPVLAETEVKGADDTLRFTATSDGKRHWWRINLRDARGALVALTNPIYENF